MQTNEATIYTLSCPITGNIRYVGKTDYNVQTRLYSHLRAKDNSERQLWINELLSKGLEPIIEEIELVTENIEFFENFWIEQMRCWGFYLFNKTGVYKKVNIRHNLSGNLKFEILEQIKKHKILKIKLALENNRSTTTIIKWCAANDPMLTTAKNVDIICSELGVEAENIFALAI